MIKSERLSLVIELLTTQMNHWVFFPIVMTALGISTLYSGNMNVGQPDFLMWAVCGVFPFVFFLIRNCSKRFWLFILCHIAVAACSILVPVAFEGIGRLICAAVTIAYMLHSFFLRLQEDPVIYSSTIHPIAALAVSAVSNFLMHKQKDAPDWDRYYLAILIGVLACYLILYYLKQYLNFLRVNKSSAGYMPAKEILRSGIGFVLPYTLIGVLILVLSLNVEWLEAVLRIIKAGIIAFFRLLGNGTEAAEMGKPSVTRTKTGTGEAVLLPPGESFWLWEVLEYVAIVLFVCGCVFCIIRFIIMFIRLLREQFGRKRNDYAFSLPEEAVFDVHEKCGIAKNTSGEKQKGFLKRFTPAERIRRLYKKQILSGKMTLFGRDWSHDTSEQNEAALNCMTAKECGDRLSMPDMAEIYEQVRYSDREITSEDVKRMKLACKNN